MLTSPSGCRHWGHPGSDSIHQWSIPEQAAQPAGQQMTPFFTLREGQRRKIGGVTVAWISSYTGLTKY